MSIELKEVAKNIRTVLEEKRKELRLTFVENKHIYYMLDKNGNITSGHPSVTKIIKHFHEEFDAQAKSLQMAKGNKEEQKRLLKEWKEAGDDSTNLGSRVHFLLEEDLISRYDNYKKLRQPVFKCDDNQIVRSDRMIQAGKTWINLMHERGAVSLDTELIMGHPTEGYVGQCDNAWIMENKEKTGIGFVITDYKSNKPKNFEVQPYTGKLYPPFQNYPDNALGHYYLQPPLYARLIIRMLENTEFKDVSFLGGVILLLKDTGEFVEYRVPKDITSKLLTMDLTNYLVK